MNDIDKIYEMIQKANTKLWSLYKEDILFSWQWWLGVVLTILPWILWLALKKKESTDRLLYAGVWMMLISSYLDFLGVSFGYWDYDWPVIPSIPAYIPWDFALLPVSVMLFIQYMPKVKPIVKAVIYAGILAFLLEPIFIWINLYDPKEWKLIYSFFIYILIYLFVNYMSGRNCFKKISQG